MDKYNGAGLSVYKPHGIGVTSHQPSPFDKNYIPSPNLLYGHHYVWFFGYVPPSVTLKVFLMFYPLLYSFDFPPSVLASSSLLVHRVLFH